MLIEPGTRLSNFEISSHLGEGGMGEVWQAVDTRLGRTVAIKVLPEAFAQDAERLARFEREARLLATLDHPNIASIYGIEEIDGRLFLVMQLAEGEDLSDRLSRGAIPVDEALQIAKGLAEGLDAAHERGVMHRDLKPANIKLDRDGHVRILDFGLAKAMDLDEGDSDLTNSPTMVQAATQAGVILGTAAYMSPEQARGRRVDRRADIWAFGVVLWEMLAGERLFRGETVSDTLAAVLTREVDLDALPEGTPPDLRRLIGRCLEREPRQRLRDIGEATLAIEAMERGDEDVQATLGPRSASGSRSSIAAISGWVVAAALLLTVVLLVLPSGDVPAPAPALHFRSELSVDKELSQSLGASAIVSPDGSRIAFVAGDDSSFRGTARESADLALPTQLHVRRLVDLESTPLNGTEGAAAPFFSPDGEWIAFFAKGALKKIAVSGGAPLTLCEAPAARGGSWGGGNLIVFTPGTQDGLWMVSGDGGEPHRLTTPNPESRERSHRWPSFLPDARSVVFTAQIRGEDYEDSLIQIVDITDLEVKTVHRGGSYARISSSGHLMWVREGTLFVALFDLERLEKTGSPRPAIENLMSLAGNEAMDDGTAHYHFSATGVLAYRSGEAASPNGKLVWLDRSGEQIAGGTHIGWYTSSRISPDGRQVALSLEGEGGADIWIWDLERDSMARLTFGEGNDRHPIWSPDGSTIIFSSTDAEGLEDLYSKASDGSGKETLFASSANTIQASSWSADGSTLFGQELTQDEGWNLFALPIVDGIPGEASTLVASPQMDSLPEVSPDGKWIAYSSDEKGTMAVYLRAYPDTGGRWQISTDVGFFPRWTRGGRELIYIEGSRRVFSVQVDTSSGTPKLSRPELLFEGLFVDRVPTPAYDVSADGERFLMMIVDKEADLDTSNVILMTDWFERLKVLAPAE